MKKLSTFIIIGLVCLVGISYAFLTKTKKESIEPEKITSDISQNLGELNQDFKYKEKHILPRVIQAFTIGTVSIDVPKSYRSNLYYGDYENRDGLISIDLEQINKDVPEWFGYRYLGRLANGLHVVRTFYSADGTGEFQYLLLIEGLIDFEYGIDGEQIESLILKRRGSYGLGDRYEGKIKIDAKENKITVGTDERNLIKEEYVIQIK